MADEGPWNSYSGTETAEAEGPWSSYEAAPESPAPVVTAPTPEKPLSQQVMEGFQRGQQLVAPLTASIKIPGQLLDKAADYIFPSRKPLVSPETIKSAITSLTGGVETPGAPSEVIKDWTAEQLSGLTHPKVLLPAIIAKKFPITAPPIGAFFAGASAAQAPEAAQEIIQGVKEKNPERALRGTLGLAASVAIPAGVARGLRTEVEPSGIKPTEEPTPATPEKITAEPAAPAAAPESALTAATRDLITRHQDENASLNNAHSQTAGLGAKSIADLEAFLDLKRKAKQKLDAFKEQAKDPNLTPKEKLDLQMQGGYKWQPRFSIPREAIEVATNSGSWVEGEGSSKIQPLGERPLDWRKNPEVARWLVENGKEVGLSEEGVKEISDSLKSEPVKEPTKPTESTPAAPAATVAPKIGAEEGRDLMAQAFQITKKSKLSETERAMLRAALEEGNRGNFENLKALLERLKQAPPKEAPKIKGGPRGKFDAETAAHGEDILSWMVENGKVLSKSGAKKAGRYAGNSSEWDDAPSKLSSLHHGVIYSENGSLPSDIAQTAFNERKISAPTASALWSEIDKASRKRKGSVEGAARAAKGEAELGPQLERWQDATKPGPGNPIRVGFEDLAIGDRLKVGGETLRVTKIDRNSGEVILVDGDKFGTQVIPEGETLHVTEHIEAPTTETPGGRIFAFGPVGRVVTWLENLFRTDRTTAEPSEAPPPSRRHLVTDLVDRILGGDAGDKVDASLRYFAGESVPKTMEAAPESGNAMVRFASANVAAPHVARSMTREVLGDKWNDEAFRKKLGAVLVEDRLRAIRKGLQDAAMRETDPNKVAELVDQAGNVNRLTGEGQPFADETEFQAALRDPDIKSAIERHKQTVQELATKYHVEAGGQLAGAGLNTGAFVNLQALFDEQPQMVFRGAAKGDFTRVFKKRSVFSQEAKGTGQKYEQDYSILAERMIRGNMEEYTKRKLYDQLVKDGLAIVEGPGVPRPTFEGKPAVKFQIVRRGAATENLWVRPDIAPELRAAENLDGPIKSAAFTRVANALNMIQLAGPTDATWHVANMLSSISGSQGGKNLLTDLARKVPLANVVDSTIRVTLAARKVLQQDPEVLKQISELSQIGAVRPDRPGGGINSRIIGLLDKAGRVVRDDMYQNLVRRGLITASEQGRREWVNQMGQYNPRLMGQFQAFFKEAGLAPFIVAGRNFNRLALRRVMLEPGIKAANLQSAVQMRAVEAFGILATLIAVPAALNSVLVGKPAGRAGVPFGGIDTGKDDKNGKPIYIDPAQWIGLRRGMRLTGINAAIEGIRKGETTRRMTGRMGQDIIGAAVHPWAGPAVQLPVITATGKTTSGYKESKDPGNYWENVKAAVMNINPLLHGWMQKQGTGVGPGLESAARSLTGAVGIKTGPRTSALQEVHQLATTWMDRSNDPKIRHKLEVAEKQDFGESDYKGLRRALDQGDLDTSIEEYRKLLAEGKKPKDVFQTLRPFSVVESGGQYFRHEKTVAGLSMGEQQKFLKSLSPEDRKTYERSRKERTDQFEKFKDMIKREKALPKPISPEA